MKFLKKKQEGKNAEPPVFVTLRRGRHEINKIKFRRIFSLKTCFGAFRDFRLSLRHEMEMDNKSIYKKEQQC